jgi:hypothetical protein
MDSLMDETAKVRVLLVGDSPGIFSSWRRRLERNGCHCEFAECQREVWNVLRQRQFDIVLSLHRGAGTRTESLGAFLSGSLTTLFYALPVETGCWWVPVLKVGEECFSAPALRPSGFAKALDEVLEQIKDQIKEQVGEQVREQIGAGFASHVIRSNRSSAGRKVNGKPSEALIDDRMAAMAGK